MHREPICEIIVSYSRGTWKDNPEHSLNFPKVAPWSFFENEFGELNKLTTIEYKGNRVKDSYILFRCGTEMESPFSYVMVYKWFKDVRILLCKRWYDVVHFMYMTSLINIDEKLENLNICIQDLQIEWRKIEELR